MHLQTSSMSAMNMKIKVHVSMIVPVFFLYGCET
jgi:hypothetical protein